MNTLFEIHNTIHALCSSEHDVCRAETIEAMERANELQRGVQAWRDWATNHIGLTRRDAERMTDGDLRAGLARGSAVAVPLADADIIATGRNGFPHFDDAPTGAGFVPATCATDERYPYIKAVADAMAARAAYVDLCSIPAEACDAHGLAAMLADMALPDAVDTSRRVLPRGHRWPTADAARYGADVVAAWVCRRVDGTTVVVRHHVDGAWSTSAPDELDAAERPRRVVGHDSLDLAVARATSELTGALVPVRAALTIAADAALIVEAGKSTLVTGIRAAIDRALAAVTYLRAALEREEAIRG